MKLFSDREGDTLTVAVEGKLDTLTAPELEKALNTMLPTVQELILDMEKLTYISSAGLRVLISAEKTMKGHMRLTHICPGIEEIFRITGLTKVFTIE